MSQRAAKTATPQLPDEGNMSQVRELLFGAKEREFDGRMDCRRRSGR